MDKIKCIRSENGTIIPIHNIAKISSEECSHYIWTTADNRDSYGYNLSDTAYNALLEELDIIGVRSFTD